MRCRIPLWSINNGLACTSCNKLGCYELYVKDTIYILLKCVLLILVLASFPVLLSCTLFTVWVLLVVCNDTSRAISSNTWGNSCIHCSSGAKFAIRVTSFIVTVAISLQWVEMVSLICRLGCTYCGTLISIYINSLCAGCCYVVCVLVRWDGSVCKKALGYHFPWMYWPSSWNLGLWFGPP